MRTPNYFIAIFLMIISFDVRASDQNIIEKLLTEQKNNNRILLFVGQENNKDNNGNLCPNCNEIHEVIDEMINNWLSPHITYLSATRSKINEDIKKIGNNSGRSTVELDLTRIEDGDILFFKGHKKVGIKRNDKSFDKDEVKKSIVEHFGTIFQKIWFDGNLKLAVSILFVFSLGMFLYFLSKWIPLKNELKKTSKAIEEILGNVRRVDLHSYEDLHSKMNESNVFSHYWNEFDETIVKESSEEEVKVFNTKSFSVFIPLDSLLENKLSISFFRKVPSLITSIGLFFTFLFIVFGLNDLHFEGKQVVGIDLLINGLSAKFWSSVIAIFISILFTLAEDRMVNIIAIDYRDIIKMLDKKFEYKTAENYLSTIDRNIAQFNKTMKLFGTDLAGVITNGLSEGMRPSTDRLLQAISTLEQQKTENIAETLTTLLQDFKSSLNQSAGSEFAELGNQISRLAQVMNEASEKSIVTSNRMDNLVRSIDENLVKQENTSAYSINKVQESFERIIEDLTRTSKQQSDNFRILIDEMLRNTSSATTGVINNVETITNKNAAMVNNFENLNSTLGQNIESYTRSAGITQELIQSTGAVVNQVNASVVQLNEIQSKIDRTYQQFLEQASVTQQIQQNNIQAIDKFKLVFTEVESGLEVVLRQIGDNISKYNDLTKQGLESYLNEYDNSLASATTKLSSTVRDMDEVLENLNENLEIIKTSVKSENN